MSSAALHAVQAQPVPAVPSGQAGSLQRKAWTGGDRCVWGDTPHKHTHTGSKQVLGCTWPPLHHQTSGCQPVEWGQTCISDMQPGTTLGCQALTKHQQDTMRVTFWRHATNTGAMLELAPLARQVHPEGVSPECDPPAPRPMPATPTHSLPRMLLRGLSNHNLCAAGHFSASPCCCCCCSRATHTPQSKPLLCSSPAVAD